MRARVRVRAPRRRRAARAGLAGLHRDDDRTWEIPTPVPVDRDPRSGVAQCCGRFASKSRFVIGNRRKYPCRTTRRTYWSTHSGSRITSTTTRSASSRSTRTPPSTPRRTSPARSASTGRRTCRTRSSATSSAPRSSASCSARRGISNDHTVVLYGDRNNWFAAYTYWYLKYYGHDNVKLVNGPREKWIAEGRPTSDRGAQLRGRDVHGAGRATTRIRAKRDEVLAALDADDQARRRALAAGVLGRADRDGRLRAGGRAARRPHPRRRLGPVGAGGEGGRHVQVGRRAARALRAARACSTATPIIAYCRIGERSAHTWFVLHELLGQDDVKNYDGSWTEWGNLVDVPIEKDV